jgi:hypothetical protein
MKLRSFRVSAFSGAGGGMATGAVPRKDGLPALKESGVRGECGRHGESDT